MSRLSQWFVITLLLLGFFGGYFWYRSKAGTTTNAPETTNNTLTTGLVGHWTFDAEDMDWASSGAEVLDRTASSNEGDLSPTYFSPVPGVLGQAIHSDGTAWETIELNSATNLEMGTGDLTLCEWINITSATTEVRSFQKKPTGSESTEGYSLYYSTDLDVLTAQIGTGSTFTYYASNEISFALEGSGWHHIAAVIDRDAGVSFYLDGAFLGKDGSSVYNGTDITNVAEPGYIAFTDANADVVSHDDLRIYNRVLSASEVYQLATAGKVTVNAPLDDPLSQGLRGYWKLDDGSGTNATDSSGNTNTLAMTGSPSWTTGNIGPYALDFSGSGQYLSVASPASGVLDFAAGASFSITGWFNRDTFTTDHTIVAKRNGQTATDDGYIVYIDDATDTLVFEASDTADTDEYQRVSTSTFTATGWHQFAVTWNDSATTDPVNIFIDGATNNGTATGTFANMGSLVESVAFRIGAESDAGVPFDGKLDDIRVYGSALSASDVLKLYQTTAPAQPVDTGLVGHWTFDGPDIQGTTAIDRSSFGNNGTITGTTKTIGKLGQALSFNGTGDSVSAPLDLSGTPTVTVSFWLKADAWVNGDYAFDFWTVSSYFGFTPSEGGVICSAGDMYLQVSANAGPNNKCYNTRPSSGVWHHFVAVFDLGQATPSNELNLYLDSVLQSSYYTPASNNNTINFGSGTLYFMSTTTPSDYLAGRADDLRVYTRALTQAEITSLYNLGK